MNITSSADIMFSLSEGQSLGQMRRAMWDVSRKMMTEMSRNAGDKMKIVQRDGVSTTLSKRRTAWNGVIGVTTKIAAACESLVQLQTSQARAEAKKAEVAAMADQLMAYARADIPDAILPQGMRSQLQAMLAGEADSDRFATSLLGLTRPANGGDIAESLNWFNWLRLHALNANMLSEIGGIDPDPSAAGADDLDALAAEALGRSTALRDAAHDACRELRTADATPALAGVLWGALFGFEDWLTGTATTAMAKACAAATARVASGDQAAESWARDVAKAYDALRMGLAYDAGLRAILLAYARRDTAALRRFAEAGGLPAPSATLDLPRSSLAEVGARTEGDAVEIAALVTDAAFEIGGANRSILTMGPSGAVKVLVPHVAVDSFGIGKGVWLQVRGKAFPNGKDGIAGPVVMAGRIARSEAAKRSFADALIFAGRDYFDLRPGDLDIVASRIAGARATLNEIGMREI